MFGSSSTTPKVELGRGYAAAVSSVTAAPNKGASAARTTVIAVGAAVALGVSALVGGSLLYSASHRTNDVSNDVPKSTPEAEVASTSWWRRALSYVRLRRSAEDDDDAFATGTGAASLFDAEKTKARQLSKGKATPAARAPVAAAAPARKAVKVSGSAEPKPEALATIDYPCDIREREQHIKLVRALLRREAGIEYSDDDDEDSSSSDETDVSLNYHFASTMEATARDELLMAFADFEDLSDGTIFGALSQAEQAENAEQLQVNILVKILEYLDMSNEREKLRHRRIALYREQGRTTPASSADAADGADEDDEDPLNAMYRQLAAQYGARPHHHGPGGHGDEEEDEDEDFFPTAAGQQARQFQAMFGPSMMGADSHAKDANDGDAILSRILGQAPASGAVGGQARSAQPRNHAAGHVAGEDMMEDEWEDEDDEEKDFMAYLQQPDDAAHFYSREAMRQARRDPGHDVRVVGLDDDEDEREWEDDEAGEVEEEEEEEGDDMPPAEPWSRSDKADFERELFSRIHQLANNYTLTAAVAEREADEEDARKLAERQQRRQEQRKANAQRPVTAAASAITPSAAVAEDEEDWEDEDEWEDEEEEDA